jgi:protoheme ferro-lyase
LARKKKVGIVMFQLGGPDSLEAVEPFLLNLFLDPDIIPMGPLGFLRRPLAKLISSRRSIPVQVCRDRRPLANRNADRTAAWRPRPSTFQ